MSPPDSGSVVMQRNQASLELNTVSSGSPVTAECSQRGLTFPCFSSTFRTGFCGSGFWSFSTATYDIQLKVQSYLCYLTWLLGVLLNLTYHQSLSTYIAGSVVNVVNVVNASQCKKKQAKTGFSVLLLFERAAPVLQDQNTLALLTF